MSDQIENAKDMIKKPDASSMPATSTFEPVAKSSFQPPAETEYESHVNTQTPVIHQQQQQTFKSPTSPEKPILSYYPNQIDLTQTISRSRVIITHFECETHFYAQLVDVFTDFDLYFEKFQNSCNSIPSSQKVNLNNLNKMQPNVAIAAIFDEDGFWYRARIGRILKLLNEIFLKNIL